MLYKYAGYLRDTALSEEAGTVVLWMQFEDNKLSHLNLGARSFIMSRELSKNMSSKSFGSCYITKAKGVLKFSKNGNL